MDKPSQTHLYAGLLVYRSQRNIEFLLLNDSFTNKKHWFCPKGLIIGQEDEQRCALRETFETTGLGPKQLRIEEGFKIELKYLSGTRPKKVIYYLAQLIDHHARLLPNAEGVHLQWCNQQLASEKAIFKSMQDVFKYAQSFIETKKVNNKYQQYNNTHGGKRSSIQQQQQRRPLPVTASNNTPLRQQQIKAIDRPSSAPVYGSSPSPPPPTSSFKHSTADDTDHFSNNSNPLFKTRLCERFETEGSCSYGNKCTFAHGIKELRERQISDTSSPQITSTSPTSSPKVTLQTDNNRKENGTHLKDLSENPLYKTKLCERYMKDQFCQYGPKCHFAHGRAELKDRPNHHQHHQHSSSSDDEVLIPRPISHRHPESHNNLQPSSPSPSVGMPDNQNHREHRNIQLSVCQQRPSSSSSHQRKQNQTDHPLLDNNATSVKNRATILEPDQLLNGDIMQTDKSWMKVVHLTREEQAKLAMQTPSPKPSKLAQEEALINELTLFFQSPESDNTTSHENLAKDVKHVTKVEMRNDLTKSQLFYILLASLLHNSVECPVGTILHSRERLFKTFVKTLSDQTLLLKAWDKCVQRYPTLLSKSVLVLSQWYECDLLDEEACYTWHDGLLDGDMKRKTAKFIDWLKTADEED
ncbi:uncharacterized protein BX664DRAFT_314602 [Halteromyces radiatus]|uniref:uncharacterized protein n=1 Tax=Halteromyces radiatus TaxID=101107 RepID=UPI00222060CF|nr:uncharacterized protein BX664DRAFT_314602 [Halteromyces radiatus]KAI8089391.1 hypothetical protein BX664DRAFT_314602 [Halteromyces radiatus]